MPFSRPARLAVGTCWKGFFCLASLVAFITAAVPIGGGAVAGESSGAEVMVSDPRPPSEDLVSGGPVGPWRRLFLDAMVVEQSQGLERVFHAVRKYSDNPVIKKDRPWEGRASYSGPYLYGTVMWDQGKLRMWYHAHGGSGYRNCYAESTDGIHWTKPNLGLLPFEGSTENNLFLTVNQDPDDTNPRKAAGQCHNPSVIKRPWVSDPEKRYALFCYGVDHRHARVAFSPDGLRWTFVPETAEKGLFGSGDVLNFCYDPYRSRYVATWKSSNRRGRAAGVAVSSDGLEWSKPYAGPVFVADDLDPDATQIYGMPVFPYQGMYIGLPWIYNARWFKYGHYTDKRMGEVEKDSPCTMDVQLAWSWDLVNWTRPPRRDQFIPRGPEGAFDDKMIYTARAPVQVGNRLYFYYGGWTEPHNNRKAKAAIGLATLRLDGFCSMQAGDDEGWLISRREPFRVPRVTINAKTAADGYVVAELLDTQNKPIPGFTRDQCEPFTGDATAHVLEWKTGELPAQYLDVDKKIRFYVKNANLYSYLPDQTTGPVTVTYIPAENGRLLPNDPEIARGSRFEMPGKASGYRIVEEDGLVYLDLHSVAADKTNAAVFKDASWNDNTDWCVEGWYRIVDQGTEPNYGFATFFRPPAGRNASIYLSDKAAGIMSSAGKRHEVIEKVALDTTEGFHWYRMVHTGGAGGEVALSIDGEEKIRVPLKRLFPWHGRGHNIGFGPNAAHCEGRMHVARFGYRLGSTDVLFGPVEAPYVNVR